MTPPDIAAVAGKLTKAQRDVFLNGLRGKYTISTLLSLKRKGLILQLVSVPGANAWPDTETGLAVRAHLLSKEQNDGK